MLKMNKKATLSAAGVLTLGALVAIIGTTAYFTDKVTPVTNSFTVGDIEVELYESQLHRMNSGRKGTFSALNPTEGAHDAAAHYCDYHVNTGTDMTTYDKAKYCTPGMDANEGDSSSITAIANGHVGGERTWGYKDSTIESDAETYKSGYLADVASALVPGQWVRKFSYAKNTGNNDAYILIRYMIPASDASKLTVEIPSTPYSSKESEGGKAYFIPVTKDAEGKYVTKADPEGDPYEEEIGDTVYKVYAAVTTEVVKPDEMTFWSPVNAIKIKNELTEAEVTPESALSVKVDAQAIQSTTFDDAITAINNL